MSKKYNNIDFLNIREIAIKVLENAINNDYALSEELKFFEKNHDIKNINTLYELTEGVFRKLLLIDEYIKLLVKKDLNKLDASILNIIRIAIYQILFMDSVPDFASINESVNLAKKYGHIGTVKFTNGLLRNFLRKKDELNSIIDSYDFLKKISIKYSMPYWIVKYWSQEFDNKELEALLISMDEKAPIYLRINTLKITVEAFKEELAKSEIKYSTTEFLEIIKLEQKISIKNIYGYNEGFFYIQDLGAAHVANMLNPSETETIIDFCAFPGGKTSHLSQLMKNSGQIFAIDVNKKREKIFLENMNKLGCSNIKNILVSESETPDIELADKILTDPPCSGLGTIRRNSELKYRKKLDDIARLSEIQLNILTNASKYLKKGGTLVYSTCTISKTENEDNIKKFLDANKDFSLVKQEKGDFTKLIPSEHNTDGFFIAKLLRI